MKDVYSSDFNITSFNWWMEIAAKGGQTNLKQAMPVLTGGSLLEYLIIRKSGRFKCY